MCHFSHSYIVNGYPAMSLRHAVAGIEYEGLLSKVLSEAGIHFWTEEDLRDQGFVKTPDARLQASAVYVGFLAQPDR